MDIDLVPICVSVLLFYYMISIVIYFTQAKNKEFFQMVIFPLPIAIIVLFFYYVSFDLDNTNEFNMMATLLITISVMAGAFILYHCFLDHSKRDRFFYGRLLTSIILILTPLLLYSPDYVSFMMGLYLICGISLGIYGFHIYFTDKKIGLLYVYTSLVFMVIIPIISFTVAKLYLDNFEPEIIYRRARDNIVTCHLPAPSIIPGPEGFQISILFSGLYIALFGVLSAVRKNRLKKRLKRNGVIPGEFYRIMDQREFK